MFYYNTFIFAKFYLWLIYSPLLLLQLDATNEELQL